VTASAFGRGFLPGPVDVRPEIAQAALGPMLSPWSAAGAALFSGLQAPLRELFRTASPVMLAASSATGMIEAAVRNGVLRRVLVPSNGFFGEWLAGVAEACGREVSRLEAPPGRAIDPDALARALDSRSADAVALVHSETSTGVLNPLPELARVVRERSDALLLVDAVTSLGALPVETDAWGLDFVLTGSQKALALPPGLALAAASERMLARAATLAARGWYFDLLKYAQAARTDRPTQTPALSLIYALQRQLARTTGAGGVAARWSRHRELLATLERWVATRDGVALLAAPGERSWAVSALTFESGVDVWSVVREMHRRGWRLTGGLGALADRVLRVGHMGDLEPVHLEAMLADLGELV